MDRLAAHRLDPETPFLTDPSAQRLCAVIGNAGHALYFVGGCVRNAVLGEAASDIDMSTDAVPARVIEVLTAAKMRVIPTGIDHGTVTAVVDGQPFEITTFRRDVETDGRRAVVRFSTDIADDARRRDFTMNALYADAAGFVHDPLGGLPDTLARRVRFIEDADRRIKEDYLRILRFFRFNAHYAPDDTDWDAEALAAIAANLDGLDQLSAERVGAEMLKLLSAADPVPAVSVMTQAGVLAHVLPGADPVFLGPFVQLEQLHGAAINPVSRLAALGGEDIATRLRLSRKDQRHLETVQSLSTTVWGPRAIGHLGGAEAGSSAVLLRAAMAIQPLEPGILAQVQSGTDAEFPVTAADLPELSGPALGKRLKALRHAWLTSELTLDRAALLAA
ncbi:MAG: CCA tRNA nucleotidyltransferase [Pseudomonadota bacterium]